MTKTAELGYLFRALKAPAAGRARAAMIDRPVHGAEILSLKGDSYRLRDRDNLGEDCAEGRWLGSYSAPCASARRGGR